jgi:limonene-1,2-epoxide hydrolase
VSQANVGNTPATTQPKAPSPVPGNVSAVATVTNFLNALGRLDIDGALGLLSDDVVYQNVSLPKAQGKPAVAKQLGLLGRYCTGFEAINHRIVGDGDTVLTERTDIIEIRRVRSEFWVCGTFEIRDGKIVLWRDYFDWANIISGVAKGAGRALVSLAKDLRR